MSELNGANMYSRRELEDMIAKMHHASGAFYLMAQRAGNHAFIEFTGLMNEYINICEDTMNAGGDFTQATKHGGGQKLVIAPHQRDYLAQKLTCIFETSFPELMNAEKPR